MLGLAGARQRDPCGPLGARSLLNMCWPPRPPWAARRLASPELRSSQTSGGLVSKAPGLPRRLGRRGLHRRCRPPAPALLPQWTRPSPAAPFPTLHTCDSPPHIASCPAHPQASRWPSAATASATAASRAAMAARMPAQTVLALAATSTVTPGGGTRWQGVLRAQMYAKRRWPVGTCTALCRHAKLTHSHTNWFPDHPPPIFPFLSPQRHFWQRCCRSQPPPPVPCRTRPLRCPCWR